MSQLRKQSVSIYSLCFCCRDGKWAPVSSQWNWISGAPLWEKQAEEESQLQQWYRQAFPIRNGAQLEFTSHVLGVKLRKGKQTDEQTAWHFTLLINICLKTTQKHADTKTLNEWRGGKSNSKALSSTPTVLVLYFCQFKISTSQHETHCLHFFFSKKHQTAKNLKLQRKKSVAKLSDYWMKFALHHHQGALVLFINDFSTLTVMSSAAEHVSLRFWSV